jgi:hypothetical protein
MTLLPRRLEPHGFPEFAMGQNREPTTVLLCGMIAIVYRCPVISLTVDHGSRMLRPRTMARPMRPWSAERAIGFIW